MFDESCRIEVSFGGNIFADCPKMLGEIHDGQADDPVCFGVKPEDKIPTNLSSSGLLRTAHR